jgi:hypothetical protein
MQNWGMQNMDDIHQERTASNLACMVQEALVVSEAVVRAAGHDAS